MTSLESHRATILSRLGAGEPGLPDDAPPNVRAIKDHYLWAVSELCRSDDEPDAYAEIVMLDADLISLIVDRVSIGNAVARAKLAAMPELVAAPFDAPRARAALVVPAREAQVIAQAMHLGERLHMNVGPLSTLFRSIIDETVDVELRLLAGIAAQEQA